MASKKKTNGIKVYPTYRHTGQDPVIGLMKKLRDGSKMKDAEIVKRTKMSPATAKNWFSGKTRRPQHTTLAAYAGAFGKRFVLEDSNDSDPIIRRNR